MEFVNPLFLFGLFAVLIPVIIHLFNFRRFKKVYFTNVKFLNEIKLETKRRSQLKHLMVLLMRILAIAALVFAFTQPYIPVDKSKSIKQNRNVVSIYFDNSFSMNAEASKGTLFEIAKTKIKEIVAAYKTTDMFQLLTNDFEGRHQRLVNKEEFLEYLEDVSVSPAVKKISEVNKRQYDLLKSSKIKNKSAYLISDFQKSITDIEELKIDTLINSYFIPVIAGKSNNMYIDSCWFDSPVKQMGQNVKLFARIINVSDLDYEKIPISLTINDKQKALASFDIKANSHTDVVLPYKIKNHGIHNAFLEIVDSPILYDDKLYFSYIVSPTIPILCINGDNENIFLNTLFKNDSTFEFENVSVTNVDYSSFQKENLIILNAVEFISTGMDKELISYIENGGNVFVIPAEKFDYGTYQEFLSSVNTNYYTEIDTVNTKVDYLNIEHSIYNDVFEKIPDNIDLPTVNSYNIMSKTVYSDVENLLVLENGNSFLSAKNYKNGKIFVLVVPLSSNYSNFQQHAIFVPTMYKIAISANDKNKLFYILGNDDVIEIGKTSGNGGNVFKIRSLENDFEIIPGNKNINFKVNLMIHKQIEQAANYSLSYGDKELMGLSFNYNRTESDLSCYNQKEMETAFDDASLLNYSIINTSNRPITEILQEINSGVRLWKLFILMTLFFLLMEIILLRIWK